MSLKELKKLNEEKEMNMKYYFSILLLFLQFRIKFAALYVFRYRYHNSLGSARYLSTIIRMYAINIFNKQSDKFIFANHTNKRKHSRSTFSILLEVVSAI